MFSCFLHVLFDCFWYRRQATKVEDGGDSVSTDGGGPVAAEGEELEPPADAPANEEPVAAPAPATAQTTNQSTNVNGVNLEDSWTLQEHVDTGQGQRDSG